MRVLIRIPSPLLATQFATNKMSLNNWRSSKTFVTIVVCVAVFTDVFLYGLIVPVLPFTLEKRVGLSGNDIQRWSSILLACYGGSILLGSLLFGWIGDRTKTKQLPFLFGLVVLGSGTVLFSLTKTLTVIVLARLLQGLSTAIVFTIGFCMVLDAVGIEGIGRASGLISMSLSLGLFSGPIAGGFLYDSAGYFAVFVPAYILICLEICLRMLLRPEVPLTPDAMSPGEHASLLSDSEGPRPSKFLSALSVLLRNPRFAVAMVGMCLVNTFTTAYEAVLPVYFRDVFHYTSSQIAILFLSNTIPMLLSPLSGILVDNSGVFWPALLGFCFISPSMILLGLVQKPDLLGSILARLFLAMFGCGVSMALPAMMSEISIATDWVEKQDPGICGPQGAYSQAYGLSNAAFAGGALFGPLYAGIIKENAGWMGMSWALGALSIFMTLLVITFTGRKHAQPDQSLQPG